VNAHASRARLPGFGLLLMLGACTAPPPLLEAAAVGTSPVLPDPAHTLIPTAQIARAVGWQLAGAPSPAPGLVVPAFARSLDHPRWLYVLPNGDALVADGVGNTVWRATAAPGGDARAH
jgi:glucose/arabinose dehydrogenase